MCFKIICAAVIRKKRGCLFFLLKNVLASLYHWFLFQMTQLFWNIPKIFHRIFTWKCYDGTSKILSVCIYKSLKVFLQLFFLLVSSRWLWSLIEIQLMSTLELKRSILDFTYFFFLFDFLLHFAVKKKLCFLIGDKYRDCT